jgi:hypothetical protein
LFDWFGFALSTPKGRTRAAIRSPAARPGSFANSQVSWHTGFPVLINMDGLPVSTRGRTCALSTNGNGLERPVTSKFEFYYFPARQPYGCAVALQLTQCRQWCATLLLRYKRLRRYTFTTFTQLSSGFQVHRFFCARVFDRHRNSRKPCT